MALAVAGATPRCSAKNESNANHPFLDIDVQQHASQRME